MIDGDEAVNEELERLAYAIYASDPEWKRQEPGFRQKYLELAREEMRKRGGSADQ